MRLFPLKSTLLALTLAYSFTFIGCSKNNNPSTAVNDSDSVIAAGLKQGLLVYLNFNGSFADSSGNGNAVTALGGATLGYDEHGNANRAFVGSGTGQEVMVTNNGSIIFDTAFTISMDLMTNTNSSSVRQAFASMINYSNSDGVSFIFSTSVPGLSNLDFGVPDSTMTCNSSQTTDGSLTDTTSFIPQPGSWYNLVASFHKGTVQIYVNGTLVSTKSGGSTKAVLCPGASLLIGGWWSADPITINGTIDEFRLYNRVLNADEITSLAKEFQPAD